MKCLKHFDEVELLLGATRYYMGRRSYAVGSFCQNLANAWDELSPSLQKLIARDLEDEFRRDDEARENKSEYRPLGDNCDRQSWELVRSKYTPAASGEERAGV